MPFAVCKEGADLLIESRPESYAYHFGFVYIILTLRRMQQWCAERFESGIIGYNALKSYFYQYSQNGDPMETGIGARHVAFGWFLLALLTLLFAFARFHFLRYVLVGAFLLGGGYSGLSDPMVRQLSYRILMLTW